MHWCARSRLPPSTTTVFPWAFTRAEVYSLAGDMAMARRYADSARVAYDTDLQRTPDAFLRQMQRGLALAYLGQRTAAVRDGEHGFALAQATQ